MADCKAKSQWVQLALTVAFGPLGLFYSSVLWASLLSLTAIVFGYDTGGYGALLAWPAAIVAGVFCVRGRNRQPLADARIDAGSATALSAERG